MFLMFISCALVPIVLSAFVAYVYYPAQFKSRAVQQLQRCAKIQGMSIYEHLLSVENEMRHIRAVIADKASTPSMLRKTVLATNPGTMFEWLAVYRLGKFKTLAGDEKAFHTMKSTIAGELSASSQVLRVMHGAGDFPAMIYMVQRIDPGSLPESYLIGVINPECLWGKPNGSWLPDGMDFYIWDQTGIIRQPPDPAVDPLRFGSPGKTRHEQYTREGKTIYAEHWVIFLKHHFLCPSWMIAVSQSKAQVMAPITAFSRYFFLIIGAVLVLLVLLTSIMVRKSLVPIEQLMEGVRQISDNRFSHRVQVVSRDEFHELARAFNHMSNQLDKQFRRLNLRSDLDRKILSLLDTEKIIKIVLDQAHAFFPGRTGAVTILSEATKENWKSYIPAANDKGFETIPCRMSQIDTDRLLENGTGWMEIESGSTQSEFLRSLRHADVDRYVVFPVLVQRRLFALVSFGVEKNSGYSSDDLQQAREMANQLAIAFSNANLISELKVLNLGTLHALARTVDAKSSWTAGHSFRVMRACLDIGRAMMLPPGAMNDLHRSALLHDIGKIGIPMSILNKESRLAPEERRQIQTHPDIGVRILSPIKAYEHLLPIIHQHHERFDGKGYPLGLRAEQIHASARIVAVADTYDALVSDRPYRRGMPVEEAIDLIKQLAGSQLDPVVVDAFVQSVHVLNNDTNANIENSRSRMLS